MGKKRAKKDIALNGLPSWMTNIDEVQFDSAVPYGQPTIKIPKVDPVVIAEEDQIFNAITNNMLLQQMDQQAAQTRNAYPVVHTSTPSPSGTTFTNNYLHTKAETFAQELLADNHHVWRGNHPQWKSPCSSDIYLGRFGRFDLWWATAAEHGNSVDEFVLCEEDGHVRSCGVDRLAAGNYETNVHHSTFLVAQRRLNSLCWKHKDELIERLARGERNIHV